ncbi:MAG: nucleotidyl transferase AbiEii/AbiGii toxin family protein [Ignavibacteria bacterium]
MRDLQTLEIFEIEILELLNSIKILDYLYFGGGTMLGLCHNLNRYSTDLDFWLDTTANAKNIFNTLRDKLTSKYKVTNSENACYTILFEIQSPQYIKKLKIEIRKDKTDFEWERKIAFSKFTNKQVVVKALTLNQMMKNKIDAFLSKKLIRDCFDIEFMFMRGVEIKVTREEAMKILKIINDFTPNDYKVKLGEILDSKDRQIYLKRNFSLLKEELNQILNNPG